jgi:hypothetical protein
MYKASVSGGRNAIEVNGSYCWAGVGQTRVNATGLTTNVPTTINLSVPSGTTLSGSYTIRNYI